jgi:hypothetical protein
MTKTLKSFREQGRELDYKAPLRPSMLEGGVIDGMLEDSFGSIEDYESPEERKAWAATREYCLKYLDRFFIEGDGAWEDLGSLSISLSMFFDGYVSALKGEVAQYN